MPTTVHLPKGLLDKVDERAKARAISRNRYIVETLSKAVEKDVEWSSDLRMALRGAAEQPDLHDAVDEMMAAIRKGRRSKGPPSL